MSGFRFIHSGDVHLDSPLKGLAGQEGAAAARIRTATRTAFSNLIDAAIEEEVSFVVIAGDLYDGDWRDYQTGLFFIKEMGRLAKESIPVYLVYGNHDAESQITRRLQRSCRRSGSGSQSLERWLTHGRWVRSVSAPVIRSARVRPARLVVETPSPT